MENLLIKEYANIKRQELNNSPYSCLDSTKIDINPHQVEAFVFAISAIKNGGAILADEVGLGKTIEAGLVLSYLLKNNYHKVLLIMPSNLRKQWQIELDEKFEIDSLIVDSQNLESYYDFIDEEKSVVITSYNFVAKRKDIFSKVSWDFIVFDEAHRLRNTYKNGSKTANKIYELTKGVPKIMLTATPMQNTLLDIFGLVQFIDDKIFLDKRIFNQKYVKNQEFSELKMQLEPVLQRTLRSEVMDYLQFKSRIGITVDFKLEPMEGILYKLVNDYLKKEIVYAIPSSNRNLLTVVIRKMLASSSRAVATTFEALKERLVTLKESTRIESVDKGLDYFFDFLEDDANEEIPEEAQELYPRDKVNEFIQYEIEQVDGIITVANKIKKNAKMEALKQALDIAFSRQQELGISKKAVVFTESVRTQEYLFEELTEQGYADNILVFNGNMSDSKTKEIYKAWRNRNYGKTIGSRSVEIKNAVVEAFRDEYKILLVTDSGSEGLNLQFCNTIINYDLPWNPQKIEQRIGRCHRYGQKNDVVVINLLNTENVADRRVYEILSEKFELFEGVFGASDKAIGLLESGENFEKRILQIYQQCKNPAEFNREFKGLEKELDRKRNARFQQLKSIIAKDDENTHKQAFSVIMKDINQYFEDRKTWYSVSVDDRKKHYPIAYEVSNVSLFIDRVEQGYIFIGGFYNNQKLLSPVLCMYDTKHSKIELTETETLAIVKKLSDNDLREIELWDSEVEQDGDLIYTEKLVDYQNKYEKAIHRNRVKIDNWKSLRCEEYNLRIQECKEQVNAMQEEYLGEKNFMAKIEIKKRMESIENKQNEMIQQFHTYNEGIQLDADKIKVNFESQFKIDPFLFAKIIVKF